MTLEAVTLGFTAVAAVAGAVSATISAVMSWRSWRTTDEVVKELRYQQSKSLPAAHRGA